MRNISFTLTEVPFLAGTKDVTRRLGWLHARPGKRVCGCRKTQGLKPGELERWRVIEFVDVRREPLSMVDDREAAREGFSDPHAAGVQAPVDAGRHDGGRVVTHLDAEAKARAKRARQVKREMKRMRVG